MVAKVNGKNSLMYYEVTDGTLIRENEFYRELPKQNFVSQIPVSASTPTWTAAFFGGVGDGVRSTWEGINYAVHHPIQTIEHFSSH